MGKKQRSQDDSSDDEPITDLNDILNEDDDDDDNPLLKKVQRFAPENYDDEDEVMEFQNDDSDNEQIKGTSGVGDEDEEDFDLPSKKAWGKRKKAYYSTDYVDADYDSINQKDVAVAKMEEKEAKNLQERLAKELDEADFGLDFLATKTNILDDDENDENEKIIKTDLSKLTKKQKLKLLEKESPEFLPLVKDLRDQLLSGKTIIFNCLDEIEKSDVKHSFLKDYLTLKYSLSLHYCMNIFFYMVLKASKEDISSHGLIKRLAQYKHLLSELDDSEENIMKNIKKSIELSKEDDTMKNKKLLKQKKSITFKETSDQEMMSDEELDEDGEMDDKGNKLDESMKDSYVPEDEESTEIGKRAITYQIAKNKGLTPARKKEQRNPRVKHRNAYRKAKIRRKGAVREVRKETTRYTGEISGVKANVSKSIKFK